MYFSALIFINWYFFAAAGLLFGAILRGTADPDRLYGRLLIGSGCVMAAYIAGSFVFGAMFLSRNRLFYAASTLEAAGLLSIDLFLLSAFYFLLKKVGPEKLRIFLEMSRNLTPIYLIHWCILGMIDSIACYLLGVTFSWAAIYGMGLMLIVVSFFLARLWRRKKSARKARDPVGA